MSKVKRVKVTMLMDVESSQAHDDAARKNMGKLIKRGNKAIVDARVEEVDDDYTLDS